jgi:uncharacterized protein YdcH (DUF465 family)
MTDAIDRIVERFPENKEVIRLLQETNSQFAALCEEYVTVNNNLDALEQMKVSDLSGRISVLRRRRMTVEEELLTMIEGYSPV